MYCPKCGNENNDNNKFCKICGSKLKNMATSNSKKEGHRFSNRFYRRDSRKTLFIVALVMLIVLCIDTATETIKNGRWRKIDGTEFSRIRPQNENMYCEEISENNIVSDQDTGIQFADNELILDAVKGIVPDQIDSLVVAYGGRIVGYIEATNTYQIRFTESYDYSGLQYLAEQLSCFDEVQDCEVNCVTEMEVFEYPNDSKWKNLWEDIPGGKNWGMEAVHAPKAWNHYNEMSPVYVGVYDNMFFEHEDLNMEEILCNINEEEADVDQPSHGTHVAGIIGATYDNSKGICGVFPKAKLYGVSFQKLSTYKYGSLMDLKVGLTYLIAIKHCKVINMSMGQDTMTFAASRGNTNAQNAVKHWSESIGSYLKILLDLGNDFVICKAAGNLNSTGSFKQEFVRMDPSDHEKYIYGYARKNEKNKEDYNKYKDLKDRIEYGNVDVKYDYIAAISDPEVKSHIIVVGAAQNRGSGKYIVADFSNCGSRIDVLAPGVNIYSTVHNYWGLSSYGNEDGTSMATPFVSGVAAMIYAVNPSLKGDQVKKIICRTSQGKIKYDGKMGKSMEKYAYPMLNAEKAVEKAIEEKSTENGWLYRDAQSQTKKQIEKTSEDEKQTIVQTETRYLLTKKEQYQKGELKEWIEYSYLDLYTIQLKNIVMMKKEIRYVARNTQKMVY